MLKRITDLLLNSDDDEAEPSKKSDVVLADLESAISSIDSQTKKIERQEKQMQERLQEFIKICAEKQTQARIAYSKKDKFKAENLYKESLLVEKQVKQYKRLIAEMLKTKRKLVSQRNQFSLAKDQIQAKITLGEAKVDASQKHAELAEQLMFLKESNELSQYDDLISEAESKSQAIHEIQSLDDSYEEQIEESAEDEKFEEYLQAEKQKQIEDNLASKKKILEQVFGNTEQVVDQSQKLKQNEMLKQLKEANSIQEDKMKSFFKDSESRQLEQQDRIKDFFGS
ncbi:MAG: hypothetical protein NXI20_04270 [bacterium]|nr:hypothetical protein [bacterium]